MHMFTYVVTRCLCYSVPLTKEHLEALNAFVFHRVPVEEVGLVPAALEWVKLECQLGTSQRRYTVLKRWKEGRDSEALARMLYEGVGAWCVEAYGYFRGGVSDNYSTNSFESSVCVHVLKRLVLLRASVDRPGGL